MKVSKMLRNVALLGLMSLCTLAGCLGSPPAPEMPTFDPDGSAAAAMEQLDANKDGKLDAKELEKSPGLKAATAELDTNQDKSLDKAELTARLQSYADGGVARKTLTAQVWMDNGPLTGAEVKFVPEAFMMGAVQEAKGVVDPTGMVFITIPGVDPPGVSVGFYKVQVTKKDAGGKELVPAKFNTETTLGIEVPAFSQSRTTNIPTFILKR